MNRIKNYEVKKYLHFDDRINQQSIESIEDYVTDQNMIAEHSFFPLIHYVKKFEKYDEKSKEKRVDKRPIKVKERDIMYASHRDNIIYKYYGENLNEYYNKWVEEHGIDDCSVAYRRKEDGKSNIDFASEVINKISIFDSCYIMVGDFEKFFDRLNHAFLKERIKDILGVTYLGKDWYNVFKSVTKFSYFEKRILNKELGTEREIKAKKQYKYFKTYKEFREFKKKYKQKYNIKSRNKESFGIPQGTAISAVLANVYTTSFDVAVNNLVLKYGGIYRRYSDDFIIVIPKNNGRGYIHRNEFINIVDKINEFVRAYHLHIQEEKTQLYDFTDREVIDINKNERGQIDYLGFVFDGQNVQMRSKSPYKFYRNAYKLINRSIKVKQKKNLSKLPYRKKIYGLYTDMGINRKPHGNFITYAMRSQEIFDEISPHTNNLMMQQIKNRKKKLEKRLGVKLSI